jgi:drug/metabolite transporter (DMT)-like permease
MKKTSDDLTGWQIGAIRITAAGLVFLPFAIFHIRQVPLRKIPLIVASGMLGNLFPAFLFAIAIEKKVNSSLAGILNSLTPLFVIVIGILFFRMKVEGKKIAGVMVGFLGLLMLSLSQGPLNLSDLGYTLLILVATLMYGINVNIVAQYLQNIAPFKLATISMSLIALPAACLCWYEGVFELMQIDQNALNASLIVAVLGITGTAIATVLFYSLIQRSGRIFASLVTYAIPVVTIFWGLIYGEEVTAIQVGCLGLILAGVYLANK